MADDITISIDGVEITTQAGKMVLDAAVEAGVYVPYLCYHPGMKPYAACRMCVVSVEGGRGFPASCTLPVQDGMKIHSETGEVHQLRKSVMEMLIAEHPDGCLTCHRVDICGPNDVCLRHVSVNDRCVTCPKNERCEFKDTVRYLGMSLESPLEYKYRGIPLEVGDPFYDRDYNLCIVCGRCVRACEELRGDDAICFTQRSGMALVGTSFGTSLLESGCEFCGACIDVCPVGALTERDHKWEKPAKVERTICPHCPVGCQINLEISSRGKMIRPTAVRLVSRGSSDWNSSITRASWILRWFAATAIWWKPRGMKPWISWPENWPVTRAAPSPCSPPPTAPMKSITWLRSSPEPLWEPITSTKVPTPTRNWFWPWKVPWGTQRPPTPSGN